MELLLTHNSKNEVKNNKVPNGGTPKISKDLAVSRQPRNAHPYHRVDSVIESSLGSKIMHLFI